MSTLGQSVIVEPKPGAGERIAAQYVMTQPPDGYTLYLITGGANVISATDPQAAFSTLKDFSYISTITLFPFALFVGEKSPLRTLKDLMAAARERPGKLNYGHAGTGNTLHLAIELLKSRTGIEMEPVAYKDQAQMITDVMNGRLDMSVSTFTNFHSALVNRQARAHRGHVPGTLAAQSRRRDRWPTTSRTTKSCRGWASPPRPVCRRHRPQARRSRQGRGGAAGNPDPSARHGQRGARQHSRAVPRARRRPTTTNGSRSRRSSIPDAALPPSRHRWGGVGVLRRRRGHEHHDRCS